MRRIISMNYWENVLRPPQKIMPILKSLKVVIVHARFVRFLLMRGKHRSTPIEDLVKQAENLARDGVKELILIAQDLTYYGLDIYKKRHLAELLKALVKVEGIEWIRMHYAFPTGFPMDVLEVMKQES